MSSTKSTRPSASRKPSPKLRRPRRTAAQLEAAESAWIEKELRYMNPSDIAADFTTVAERRAIAAVFQWLSLNGVCAWQLKGGTYSTTAMGKGIDRLCQPSHAIVLEDSAYEAAREILGL